jgi:D-alanyl-D-alanine carboxypeptidase
MKFKNKLVLSAGLATALVTFTGYTKTSLADEISAKPMYRMYNPNSGEHFYTANGGEAKNLIKLTWQYEGIGWYAPDTGKPVYRVYNPNAGDHHYTTSKGEKDSLVNHGWRDEGIGWQSDIEQTKPIYRAYNPNAKKAGSHNFTSSLAEQNSLISYGWRNEGISWYATNAKPNNQSEDWTLTPENGSYNVSSRIPVRSSPLILSPITSYLPAGQTVNYDNKVSYDGVDWLSYIDNQGNRSYIQAPTNSRSNGFTYVDGILIVNKKNSIPKSYAPGENSEAVANLRQLISAMQAQGMNVSNSYSGYRSYATQAQLYQNYVNQDGQAAADTYSARPGFSEHQTGLAYDLLHRDGSLIESTRESTWIAQNAHKYGFIVRFPKGKEDSTGYQYEPWHVRYVGKKATDIYKSGKTLEEYFNVAGGKSY